MATLVGSAVIVAVGGWTGAVVGLSMTVMGLMLIYTGLFTNFADDVVQSRQRMGLPGGRKGQVVSAALGGALMTIFGVASIIASFV